MTIPANSSSSTNLTMQYDLSEVHTTSDSTDGLPDEAESKDLVTEYNNNYRLEMRHRQAVGAVLWNQRIDNTKCKNFYEAIIEHDKGKNRPAKLTKPVSADAQEATTKVHKTVTDFENATTLDYAIIILKKHIIENEAGILSTLKKTQIFNTIIRLRLSEDEKIQMLTKVLKFQDAENLDFISNDIFLQKNTVDFMLANKLSARFISSYLNRIDYCKAFVIDNQILFKIIGASYLSLDDKESLVKQVLKSDYLCGGGLNVVARHSDNADTLFHLAVTLERQYITDMLLKHKYMSEDNYLCQNFQGFTAPGVWREHQIGLLKKSGTPV